MPPKRVAGVCTPTLGSLGSRLYRRAADFVSTHTSARCRDATESGTPPPAVPMPAARVSRLTAERPAHREGGQAVSPCWAPRSGAPVFRAVSRGAVCKGAPRHIEARPGSALAAAPPAGHVAERAARVLGDGLADRAADAAVVRAAAE